MHLSGCCPGLGQFEADAPSWTDIFKQGVQDVEQILTRPRYPGATPPYVSPLPPPLPTYYPEEAGGMPQQQSTFTSLLPWLAVAGLAFVAFKGR